LVPSSLPEFLKGLFLFGGQAEVRQGARSFDPRVAGLGGLRGLLGGREKRKEGRGKEGRRHASDPGRRHVHDRPPQVISII
jgi:hypothetical protein